MTNLEMLNSETAVFYNDICTVSEDMKILISHITIQQIGKICPKW